MGRRFGERVRRCLMGWRCCAELARELHLIPALSVHSRLLPAFAGRCRRGLVASTASRGAVAETLSSCLAARQIGGGRRSPSSCRHFLASPRRAIGSGSHTAMYSALRSMVLTLDWLAGSPSPSHLSLTARRSSA